MLEEGAITALGGPYYEIPDLSPEFLHALLAESVDSEFFVGRVMEYVLPQDKRKFGDACRKAGGTIWRAYAKEACNWACLLNSDNQWHFDHLNIVYEKKLPTELVQAIYITDLSFRLLATPRGILSYREFAYRYGHSLKNYLIQWRAKMVEDVEEVLTHGFSPLRKVRASAVDKDGRVSYIDLMGPETLALEFWKVPAGYTLLTVE